ncbi:MAG: acetate--CoA ligase family protein [Elusimicrobiales bacterium]|nr:acetate--CoA ligase family protein [Elusimicrobiales bacterium]
MQTQIDNPVKTAAAILKKALAEKRAALTEFEVYEIFDAFRLPTPMRSLLPHGGFDRDAMHNIMESFPGGKVVVKVISSKTLHKTEAGGVKVCAKDKIVDTLKNMHQLFPEAESFMVCEFVEHAVFSLGQELMLGARQDRAFGPVLTLGVGGTDAENITSRIKPGNTPAILPVESRHSPEDLKAFLNSAWIWKYVAGNVRGGKKLAQDEEMLKWLDAFTQLLAAFSDDGREGVAIEEMEVNPLAVSNGRLVALDGVLRLRAPAPKRRVPPTARGVQSLLRPATVAIAGVSEKKMNMGRIILGNVLKAGFPREKLYILKDFKGEIDGVKCFAKPADFPHMVDMFVVCVPSKEVPEVLRGAGHSGKVRGVVLISGGMGEKEGSESVKDEVLKIIVDGKKKNPDFSLSGGNSLGIVSNPSKVNTLFIPVEKMPPPLGDPAPFAKTALLSQSGAFIISVVSRMPHLKPVYSVSVGNQMDVTVVDYVEQAACDRELDAIFIYIEGLKDGDGLRLIAAVEKAVAAGKEMLVYKAGRTPTGQKAVMGHTASIAGDYVVMQSALKRAGACVADTLEEFDDMAQLMSCYAGAKPSKGSVFAMSNAGFESAAMADKIVPRGPIAAPAPDAAFGAKVHAALKEYGLDSIVDVHNPLDVTPMASDAAILKITQTALEWEEADAMVLSLIPLTPVMKTLEAEGLNDSVAAKLSALAAKHSKPLVFCVAAGKLYDAYCDVAARSGIPVFRSSDRAVAALSKFMSLRKRAA